MCWTNSYKCIYRYCIITVKHYTNNYKKNHYILKYNIYFIIIGDVSKGELGFAAIPGEQENFKKSIDVTIEYAKALNCKR